jgi:pyrimidine deaminase RibD-like protein
MKLAIEQANLSKPIPSGYCVGAVLVQETLQEANTNSSNNLHNNSNSSGIENYSGDDEASSQGFEDKEKGYAGRFRVVTTGYSRELPGNTHAEECCLLKLAALGVNTGLRDNDFESDDNEGKSRKKWIMYSTMEPCSTRLSGNRSCSDRLIASGIRQVYVGVREPDHFVKSVVGVENMVEKGIEVIHIPGLEEECLAPNRHVLEL